MGQTLTTVATYHQPAEAELARNALVAAGIPAVIADAEIVAMDWLLANAVGGIKVQGRAEDADRAAGVLRGTLGPPVDEDELTRQALEAGDGSEEPADGTP